MRRLVRNNVLLSLLSLCLFVAGCAHGLGIRRNEALTSPGKAVASSTQQAGSQGNEPAATVVAEDRPHSAVQRTSYEAGANAAAAGQPQTAAPPAAGPVPGISAPIDATKPQSAPPASAQGNASSSQTPNGQPLQAEVVPPPQAMPIEPPVAGPAPLVPPNREGLINLRVDNVDVSKVIEMISRQARILNILVSPGVSGKITADLRDMTVDEALRIIARQCQLTVRRERDVIYVATLEEFRKIEAEELPVRVYHLNYVKSKDIEQMVKPLLSKRGTFTASPDSEIGLVTDAAKVGDQAKDVKAGGNSMAGGDIVVIQDYKEVLATVDRVIAQIDVQPIQVLIEAVIVSVKLEKGMELGVNFGLLDGAGRTLGVVGNGSAINAAAGFTPASVLTAGGKVAGDALQGFAKAEPGLKFGFVDSNTTGFITALETFGETKVLAAPRLLVLNKQRAEIHLGDRLGYATSTQTQTSTVETIQFQDVGTQLRLRPFVSSDGMIRMEVRPERSSGIIDTAGIPQINSTQVTTNIMIPDGATIVIGGLIESEIDNKWAGVPLLSRLPWIGYLFRHTDDNTKKRELVVILTPHIWRPQAPEALNYLGRPRTLGLDERVEQRPCEERRDGPSLYELSRPESCPQPVPPPPGSVLVSPVNN